MENRTPLGFSSAETLPPKRFLLWMRQTANQLLNNVFTSCDMKPSVIPVEVLEPGEIIKNRFSISDDLSLILAWFFWFFFR